MAKTSDKKLHGALALAVGSLILVGAGCSSDDNTSAGITPESPSDSVGNTPAPTATTNDSARESSAASVSETVVTKPTAPPPTTSHYKDGKYTALGDYDFHSGSEEITVSVTLKNDIIVDTSFAGNPTNGMSARYQDMFASGYKAMVVGQDIDTVNLGVVSGSSLTPIGFNDALAKIKAQAARS